MILDIGKLIREKVKIVIVLASVGMIAGCLYAWVQKGPGENVCVAESQIVISDIMSSSKSGVLSLAKSLAVDVWHEDAQEGESAEIEIERDEDSVLISVSTSSADRSIAAANATAHLAAERLEAVLAEEEERRLEKLAAELDASQSPEVDGFSGILLLDTSSERAKGTFDNIFVSVVDATTSTGTPGRRSAAVLGIVGLLGGGFLAICYILLLEAIKKPIRGREELSDLLSRPVIDVFSYDDSARLAAYGLLPSSGHDAETVCLLPAGSAKSVAILEKALLQASVGREDLKVIAGRDYEEAGSRATEKTVCLFVVCEPLCDKPSGLAVAKEADRTIVCALERVDTEAQVKALLSELDFASAFCASGVLVRS